MPSAGLRSRMNLAQHLSGYTIDRDVAFDRAIAQASVWRLPGYCPHCLRRIPHPSNLERHIRARHQGMPRYERLGFSSTSATPWPEPTQTPSTP
jgi:hypothetical protein